MDSDEMKKLLRTEEVARNAVSLAEEARRAVGPASGQSGGLAARELERERALRSAVTGGPGEELLQKLGREWRALHSAVGRGPIEELARRQQDLYRHLALTTPVTSPAGCVAQLVSDYERHGAGLYANRYRLIGADELARVSDLVTQSGVASAYGHYQSTLAEATRAMEAIRTPWLDETNAARSIAAFAELHGMGRALNTAEPFTETLSAALRQSLGDWRAVRGFPEGIFDDPLRRVEFYQSLGFKAALTAFPRPAFEEILDVTGIRVPSLPPAVPDYGGGPHPEPEDHEERGIARNERAYAVLLRFERQLRKFIDDKMTTTFGPRWIKQRVAGQIWQEWEKKQKYAREAGRPARPLIEYGDIGDYMQIILRADNWREVFEPIFRLREEAQVSLRRVHLIRLCTMHSRIIEPEDEMNLDVEVRRVLKAIGFLP